MHTHTCAHIFCRSPSPNHSSKADEAWYWPKHILRSSWLCRCIISRPAIFKGKDCSLSMHTHTHTHTHTHKHTPHTHLDIALGEDALPSVQHSLQPVVVHRVCQVKNVSLLEWQLPVGVCRCLKSEYRSHPPAFTLIHGSGRVVKNGKGSFIT